MATQVVYLASSVSGSAQNPNNALGNTPTTWAGTTNANTSWTHRWAFTNPTEGELTGTQSLTVTVRKGSNSNNPTLSSINVYQGGTLVAQDSVSKSISSTTGQTFTVNWAGSGSSADVHLELVTSSAGGSPSARNSVEFSHSAWTAQTVPPNLAPVANAGANQSVNVNELVTLNGSASSDPEGQTLTYNWQQTSGPAVTLSGTGANRTFTPQVTGTYVFSLVVSDGVNTSPASSTTVNVSNASPVITATYLSPPEGGWVAGSEYSGHVEVTASDPEGQSLTYNFAVISGGSGGILIEDASPVVSFAALVPILAGDYVIRATVTDPGGASSFHDFYITVASAPLPYIETPDSHEVDLGQTLSFNVEAFNVGTVSQWSATWKSGPSQPSVILAASTATTATFSTEPTAVGTHVLTISATGTSTVTKDVTINVAHPYTLPSIDLYVAPMYPATTIFAGEEFYIDATSARQWIGYGHDIQVTFIEVYGPSMLTWTDVTANEAFAIASVPGEYSLTASITDARGNTASSNVVFIVQDANATVTQWYVVQAGVEVALPPFEGIVENGAITPGTMGET